MITTSGGGYKNSATTYDRGSGYGRGSHGKGNISKVCSHCGRTGYTIDTCYKKHGFPPHFKFKNQNHDQNHVNAVSQNAYSNNDKQNHEGSKAEIQSQQISFTPEQYQTLLALLQQSKSNGNVSNQVSVIPSNTTTHTGNKFISSFSSWILDSGATDHICSSLTHFTSYHQINPISVKLPNGNQVIANYSGSVFINQDHVLDNVLYIPNFTFNLLSVAKLIYALSCVITFDSNGCHIQDKNSLKMIGSAEMQDRLYILRVPSYQKLQIKPIQFTHTVNFTASDLEILWHFRLGYVSNKCIDVIKNRFPFVKCSKFCVCDVCHFAKQKRLPFPLSTSKSKKCFDLIHVDLWGPYSIPSIHGHKYFLTIVDDYSRYTWIFLLKQKYEVVKILEIFVNFVQTQFETTIKAIRSDNGTEFFMTNFFANKGIIHQTSCVNTPQQNSIVEGNMVIY